MQENQPSYECCSTVDLHSCSIDVGTRAHSCYLHCPAGTISHAAHSSYISSTRLPGATQTCPFLEDGGFGPPTACVVGCVIAMNHNAYTWESSVLITHCAPFPLVNPPLPNPPPTRPIPSAIEQQADCGYACHPTSRGVKGNYLVQGTWCHGNERSTCNNQAAIRSG